MKKLIAFTLTEVMVTVAIIGVVSALTIPNLVKNYQKKAQVTQLRKVVSEIESAIDMLITEESKTKLATTSIASNNGLNNFIETHFKVIKTCNSNKTNECFANINYLPINEAASKAFRCSGKSYVLANSAAICANKIEKIDVKINAPNAGSLISTPFRKTKGINIELFIDTNGAQPPNIGGRDMFHVYIQPDGKIYDKANVEDEITICDDTGTTMVCNTLIAEVDQGNCLTEPFGTGCFANILNNNWEMNY